MTGVSAREILAQEMECRGESNRAQNIMAAAHGSLTEDAPVTKAALAAMERYAASKAPVVDDDLTHKTQALNAIADEIQEAFRYTGGQQYAEKIRAIVRQKQ